MSSESAQREPSAQPVALLGAAEIRELADRHGLRPTKQRGQNFVVDANTVRRIVRAAGLRTDDVVAEVGPGFGSLTLALFEAVRRVIAIEVDDVLADALPETIAQHTDPATHRLDVVHADALRVDSLPVEPTMLVANLPYNVSVPVLLHFLATFPSLRGALVMVQAEVAARLCAQPGSRTYGAPSVKTAWYAHARPAGNVARSVFWPVPNVDSQLVALSRTQPPPVRARREQVFAVVDAGFAQRRKTLRAALSGLAGSPDRAERALDAAGISPRARAESLGVGQFGAIADALCETSR